MADELLGRMHSFKSCRNNDGSVNWKVAESISTSIHRTVIGMFQQGHLRSLPEDTCWKMLRFLEYVLDIVLLPPPEVNCSLRSLLSTNQNHGNSVISVKRMMMCVLNILSMCFPTPLIKKWIQEQRCRLQDFRMPDGETLLHFLCASNNPMLMELLAKMGQLDVNTRDNTGKTPLHLISSRCRQLGRMSTPEIEKMAEILIDNGAHMDLVCNEGKTAAEHLPTRLQNRLRLNLRCQAAHVIREHNLAYNHIPESLVKFIDSHKKPQ